jgi:AraC-like DNA-binding protein
MELLTRAGANLDGILPVSSSLQLASTHVSRHRVGSRGAEPIGEEMAWRVQPANQPQRSPREVRLARWTEQTSDWRYHAARSAEGEFTIEIFLGPTTAALSVDGRKVHEGRVAAGMLQVTGPGCLAEVEFDAPCDLLHLFVPRALLSTYSDRTGGSVSAGWLAGLKPTHDPDIERLALSLLRVSELEEGVAAIYLDGITSAIVARLASRGSPACAAPERRNSGLVQWRLKRVTQYIDNNLGNPIRLDDLARCSGLSRMHFAAQFRAATGSRPHDYVLRRRIEHAQHMLRHSSLSLVDVALSVGFQTQAHFTTMFRRFVSETPGRWRNKHANGRPGSPCSSSGMGISRLPSAHGN